MSYSEIVRFLPGIYELSVTMDEGYQYLRSGEAHSAAVTAGLLDQLGQAAELIRQQVRGLGIPVEDGSDPEWIPEHYEDWRTRFWDQVMTRVTGELKSASLESKELLRQNTEEEMEAFAAMLACMPLSNESRGLLLFLSAELCGESAPLLSFRLGMEGIRQIPNCLSSIKYNSSEESYQFQPDIFDTQHQFTRCPICGGEGSPFRCAPSWKMRNFSRKHLPWRLWMKCSRCGNLYTRYMQESCLHSEGGCREVQPDPSRVHSESGVTSILLWHWCDVLRLIRQYQPGRELLEIGIGDGALIAAAQELGYRITAVELLQDRAEQAADLLQLPVLQGDFFDFPEDRQFDIISMGDVLEHLERPRAGLEKARRLLRDGGVLWLSTPNYQSAYNRLHGMRTYMWCEPYHVTYFSREGLERLLDELGFRVLEYRISIHYNGSMELLVEKKSPAD